MTAALPHRSLGSTGLIVSRVGLGLAAVARPGYITLGRVRDFSGERSPAALWERSAALLDAARAAGVRYFDVARSYGGAEEFLARWLRARALPRDAATVGSKWGYRYTADWRVDAPVHEQKELSLSRFRSQLAESYALLGPWLDLYQIHSATAESGCLTDGALLAALVEGRRSGAYRAVGLTLTGAASADTLALAVAARVDGVRVFDVVQATFNILEPSLAGPLADAHAAGLGVIVKEAFANGRLSDANTLPGDAALLARLRAVGTAHGLALDQLAVAFVLAHPCVDVVLSGAATTAQLASHLAVSTRPLDADATASLATLAETPQHYWRTRGTLPWT